MIRKRKYFQDVEEYDGISTALGLANVEVDDDYCLTDKVTPRQFADLMSLDIATSRVLFQAYGASVSQYTPIFQDVDSYTVSIMDILMFVHEQMDYGVIDLGEEKFGHKRGFMTRCQTPEISLRGEESIQGLCLHIRERTRATKL